MGEHWEFFLFLAGLVAAWSLILLGFVKACLKRNQDETDKRFASMGETAKDYARLERSLLELKAELPLQYVRKEDDIRQQVTINAKLDRLAEKIDELRAMRGSDE
jgi:hypothetical protein